MDYEEISLKELIIILIKGWKWIVGITVLTTIAAIVFTLGFKPVLYESNSYFNITIPVNVETQYGTYKLPSTKVADYTIYLTDNEVLDKVIDSLSLNISRVELNDYLDSTYDVNNGVNLVNTSVQYEDSSLSVQIHQIWLESFKTVLEERYQQLAVDSLIAQRESQIDSLYSEQNALRTEIISLNAYKETLTYHEGVSELESADNHLYYLVLNQESDLALRDSQITTTILTYQADIEELNKIAQLNQYNDKLNVLKGTITLPVNISEPVEPIDNGLLLNTAIGLVLGAMIGTFIVFFIQYWKSEKVLV